MSDLPSRDVVGDDFYESFAHTQDCSVGEIAAAYVSGRLVDREAIDEITWCSVHLSGAASYNFCRVWWWMNEHDSARYANPDCEIVTAGLVGGNAAAIGDTDEK